MNLRTLEGLRVLSEKNGQLDRDALRVERLLEWARSDRERMHAVSAAARFLELLSTRLRKGARRIEAALPSKEGEKIREDHALLRPRIEEALRTVAGAQQPEAFRGFMRLLLNLLYFLREHVRKEEEYLFYEKDRERGAPPGAPRPPGTSPPPPGPRR